MHAWSNYESSYAQGKSCPVHMRHATFCFGKCAA